MRILLNNKQIWEYTHNLKNLTEEQDLVLPAKISYAIQNNYLILLEKFELIEKMRIAIGRKYGEADENNTSYQIKKENLAVAQQELEDLLTLEHKVDIILLSIKDLEKCSFNMNQMKAIHFMLDRDTYFDEEE